MNELSRGALHRPDRISLPAPLRSNLPAGGGGFPRLSHRWPVRSLWSFLLLILVAFAGCNRSSEQAGQSEQAAPLDQAEGDEQNRLRLAGGPPATGKSATGESATGRAGGGAVPRVAPPVRGALPLAASGAAEESAVAAPSAAAADSGLQLPPGRSPQALKSFLAVVDREIENLGSGRSPIQERAKVVAEIQRVADLKQQAADRLLDLPDLKPEDEAIGIRARMQALSHKAALGDLPAAESLEKFAVELLNHPIDDIARDSRAVLIGFSLERLQGGVTEEPTEVLNFVSELASRPALLDASSLMAMQRAMNVLGEYGYVEAADQVRGQIASAFSDLQDPQLSQLAMDVLAVARFDELESMRRNISAADGLSPEDWRAKAADVAAKQPDLLTLQYLASLALQMEAMGQGEQAAVVYEAIEQHLAPAADTDVATAAGEAIDAYQARRSAIGQPLEISATTDLAGEPFAIADFSGSIVLMPFWAVDEPGSIDALPGLEQFAAEQASQQGPEVKIAGVNMDSTPAGQERAIALASRSMPWPSVAAADGSGSAYDSQLARRLGIVSLPTVVVLNPAGEIAAVALSHHAVAEAVQKLREQ